MEFELGRTYSGYRFLDVANRSKTGVEYRVQNTLAQRMELLKALPPSDQGDLEASDRFLHEMRVRARLAHPNIVTFFTALPIDGQMVMTTELFEGLPLADRLQVGPLRWRNALQAARQLLAAVACAHSLKIVHRDITPANIVLSPDGVLKLTNFRFAIAVNSPRPSESGAIVGSPKYMSPEQVKGAQDVDERSDLYSIGIVLYEMLCGRTPFDAQSQFEVMLAHVNQLPDLPADVNPSLPRELDAVVLKALAKAPEHRYQSAAAFADALEWVSSQLPAEAPEPQAFRRPDLCHDLLAAEAIEPPVAEAVAAFEPAPPTGVNSVPEQVSHTFSLPDFSHDLPAAEAVASPVVETVEPPVAGPVAAFEPAPPQSVANVPEPASHTFSLPDFSHDLPAAEAVASPVAETVEPLAAEPVAAFDPAPPQGVNNVPEPVNHTFSLPDFCHDLPAVEAVASPVAETVEPLAAEPVAAFEPAPPQGVANVPEPVSHTLSLPDFSHEVPEVEAVPSPAAETVEPLAAEPVAAFEPAPPQGVDHAPEPVSHTLSLPDFSHDLAAVEALPSPVAETVELPAAEPVAAAEPLALETVEPTAAEPVVAESVQARAEVPVVTAEPVIAEAVKPHPVEPAGPTALPPDPIIQANLWAAAAIVAQAAAAPARPSRTTAEASKPLTAVQETALVPTPLAIAPPASNPSLRPVPLLLRSARHVSESVQWAIFGGTAGFLGVVWFAIWLSIGGQ